MIKFVHDHLLVHSFIVFVIIHGQGCLRLVLLVVLFSSSSSSFLFKVNSRLVVALLVAGASRSTFWSYIKKKQRKINPCTWK